MNNSVKFQKPFVKWLGGKTQIIDEIINMFPLEINNYHEIFLGGGSVLFALLTLQNNNKIKIHGKIYAYDINSILINSYKNIKNNKDEIHKWLTYYFNEYNSIEGTIINRKPSTIEEAKTSKESFYYWIRNQYNNIDDKTSIKCSAMFIFINKSCFRGIYREGPNGFNVPYGNYKKINVISYDELCSISELIKNVEFIHSEFNNSIEKIQKNDFVYLDPPYYPENSKSFVKYTKNGFTLNKHKELFDEIIKFNSKNIKFILTNSKVEFVENYFKDYNPQEIIAKRSINSKKPDSKSTELIINNL